MKTNHDDILLKALLNKRGRIDSNKTRKLKKYPNILSYLNQRYQDSFSIPETINRMHYHVNEHPKCPICGKYVAYSGINNGKVRFKYTCSSRCANYFAKDRREKTCMMRYGIKNGGGSKEAQEKIKKTSLQHFGVDHPWKSKEVRNKCTETLKKEYGVTSPFQLNSTKKKILSKYGVDNIMKLQTIKNKIQNTCLSKYGVDHPWKSKEIRNKCLESFKENTGCNSPIQMIGIVEKVFETRKRNHTLNTSKPEEQLYKDIYSIFPSVIRQHKESRYPYHCDFYIPELDMFIELQGSWTHGKHPYNSNSIKDQVILEQWKERSEEHPFYKTAIKVWIEGDVKKRNCAKEHNLNYIELFSKEDINLFLIKLKEYKENEKSI